MIQKNTKAAKKSLGLYIHIPFCKTICVYCNFLTFANKSRWIVDYIEALKKEIIQKASAYNDYIIETIYFGGGTPSLIDAELVAGIISELRTNFCISKKPEICLEANPESLTSAKLDIYRQAGINRISLGVQSLNPKTLWKVARPHNEKASLEALTLLNKAKWGNFACDLIIGLPYQTLKEFKKQLETLLSYSPKHLSAYFLSYDTNRIDTFISDSPNESEQIKMYQYLVKRLKKAGFNHYEVSNYAQPGYECLHNMRYWQRQEYLGLGLGAHSFINETVSENTRKFEEYLKTPTSLEESYQLDQDTQRMDNIMLSLRTTTGLDLQKYSQNYGEPARNALVTKAKKYQTTKELKISNLRISLTDKGFLIADKIYQDLL